MLGRLLNLFASGETLEGYDHPELVDVVFRKTVAYQPSQPWTEPAKAVLDFGGGCGLHYKGAASDVRWAVVETPAMVSRAQELATDNLRFFTSIRDAAAWLGAVDLMYSNGALQYTSDPEATSRELCGLGAATMLWERTLLSNHTVATDVQTSRLIDNGPGKLRGIGNKSVRYRRTLLPESVFMAHHAAYSLASRDGSSFRFVRS